MIVKLNSDEIIRVDKIMRNDNKIEGYVHGKKTPEFTLTYDDNHFSAQIMTLISVILLEKNFIDINSIIFQIKNS